MCDDDYTQLHHSIFSYLRRILTAEINQFIYLFIKQRLFRENHFTIENFEEVLMIDHHSRPLHRLLLLLL